MQKLICVSLNHKARMEEYYVELLHHLYGGFMDGWEELRKLRHWETLKWCYLCNGVEDIGIELMLGLFSMHKEAFLHYEEAIMDLNVLRQKAEEILYETNMENRCKFYGVLVTKIYDGRSEGWQILREDPLWNEFKWTLIETGLHEIGEENLKEIFEEVSADVLYFREAQEDMELFLYDKKEPTTFFYRTAEFYHMRDRLILEESNEGMAIMLLSM
jgi:hypothetical protein